MRISAATSQVLRSAARRVTAAAIDFVLPYPCLACDRIGGPRPLGLCTTCTEAIRTKPGHCCRLCGTPITDARVPACGPCLVDRNRIGPDSVTWAFDYEDPIRAVIHGLKFQRLEPLGKALAQVAFDRVGDDLPRTDLVTAVPLHALRRLRRGFNQAEAIAVPLAARLGVDCLPLLARRRSTAPQARRDRGARRANVREAFRVRRSAGQRIAGRSILLVDDVTTTGLTLQEATAALRAGGAASVHAFAVARTPAPTAAYKE